MARLSQQPLKRPDLPYVTVYVNLIDSDRLFHSQWAGNGVFKNRSPDAIGAEVIDTRSEPGLILVPKAAQLGQAAIAPRDHRW